MKYLLVNHIAAAPGSDPAHLLLPADWARDVSATAAAAKRAGSTLLLATPVSDKPIRDEVEVVPDEVGFEHFPLPYYDSARSFLHVRSSLQTALANAVALADVVQLDHGGYPMPLGAVADPIAKAHGRPTLWIVNGESLPRSSLGESASNLAKRLVGRSVDQRLRQSLLAHLGSAGAVVCGSATVQWLLSDAHRIQSECIESVDVLESDLASAKQIEQRTARLLDTGRPVRFVVTGEQNIVAGTDHLIRAMHRCMRLRVPMELVILGDGVERGALLALAQKLEIAPWVRFSQDAAEIADADVWVDPALTPAAEQPLARPMATGLAPIVYRTHATNPHVVSVPVGYGDGLASALLDAAVQREKLVARMLAGVEWARARTLDAACRKRFELASSLKGDRSRPAA